MSINEMSAEAGFGSSLMDCHERLLSDYFGLRKFSLRIACNTLIYVLCAIAQNLTGIDNQYLDNILFVLLLRQYKFLFF